MHAPRAAVLPIVAGDLRARKVVQPIVYIDLGVGGMTCDDCVGKVADALESVPGVNRATVASPEVPSEALTDAAAPPARPYNAFVRRVRTSTDA